MKRSAMKIQGLAYNVVEAWTLYIFDILYCEHGKIHDG